MLILLVTFLAKMMKYPLNSLYLGPLNCIYVKKDHRVVGEGSGWQNCGLNKNLDQLKEFRNKSVLTCSYLF